MNILNKVKTLKTTDAKTFLSWTFNTLKEEENRNVDKLKNSILKSGFTFPVIVWNNPASNVPFVIDGAGRKLAVQQLVEEGNEIPEIPYVEVEAQNIEEAKLRALEVSSQYGNITEDSFKIYTGDIKVDFDVINITGIDQSILLDSDSQSSLLLPNDQLKKMIFVLSLDQIEIVSEAIEMAKGNELYEDLIKGGNSNRNGNALFVLCKMWLDNQK